MMNVHRNRKTYQYEDYWITEGSCYLPLAGEKSSAIRNLLANPPFGVIWKVTHKRERYARVDAKTPFWVHRFLFTLVHFPFEHPPQYTLFTTPPPPLPRVGILGQFEVPRRSLRMDASPPPKKFPGHKNPAQLHYKQKQECKRENSERGFT